MLEALSSFLRGAGYKIKAYSSPQAFLDEHDPSMPGCAVLDLAMPRVNGLSVQQELVIRGVERAYYLSQRKRNSSRDRRGNESRCRGLPAQAVQGPRTAKCNQGRRRTR
ncbi:MAG: response regulator [Pseudolabrys sp.]